MSSFLSAPIASIETPPAETKLTPTEEQLAIIEAATETSDNLIISAFAGAAKTSTLLMLANHKAMAATAILSLAFNKKIADEMKRKLPSNCVASTLNSLGHRAWAKKLGGVRLRIDTKKNYNILSSIVEDERKHVKEALYERFSDLLKLIAHAKGCGWVPEGHQDGTSLVSDASFFAGLDEELTLDERRVITAALNESIRLAFKGTIDFDDQIYMSTCFRAPFVQYPLTLIDEAQDLSGLNHAMLALIVGQKRLIAVGDACQAIYGFRGAYADSMSRLASRFNMHELTLSISFRCPRRVTEEAQWRAPNMKAPDWAKKGEVTTLTSWDVNALPENVAIICRNNAPLFSLAIKLLAEGRRAELASGDIIKNILKILIKLGPKDMRQEDVLAALEKYRQKRLKRARDHAIGSINDLCECLHIFISRADTLGAAYIYAERIMNQTGSTKLMTGHRSKGLEFNHVFILDKHLCRIKSDNPRNQDNNILYVMQTRAMETLTYVESKEFTIIEGGER